MKMLLAVFAIVLSSSATALAENDRLQEQFNKLDDNKNKTLTQAELRAHPALIQYTNFFSRGSFVLTDINKDGQIDFKEFVAFEEDISAE